MNNQLKSDFLFQLISLALAFIIVHSIYVGLIRPNAEILLLQQSVDDKSLVQRSIWVVLKDYEQEACFVLMLWAMAIMAMKAFDVRKQRSYLSVQLLPIAEGEKILPEDATTLARPQSTSRY